MNQERYVPWTPGGSCLMNLSAATEEQAWLNLLAAVAHMPYDTVEDLIKRGYEVLDHEVTDDWEVRNE